jgi:hypothetical protein
VLSSAQKNKKKKYTAKHHATAGCQALKHAIASMHLLQDSRYLHCKSSNHLLQHQQATTSSSAAFCNGEKSSRSKAHLLASIDQMPQRPRKPRVGHFSPSKAQQMLA